MMEMKKSLSKIREVLKNEGYIASTQILYTVCLAIETGMPILIEGEPGVGKTSLAIALANGLKKELVRVQFYEGIDKNSILYEYDYPKQLLMMNAIKDNIKQETEGLSPQDALNVVSSSIDFYSKNFIIERPLMKAINGEDQKVLLLDEIDKCSEETEYLLLELLSEYSISIPELKEKITCPPEKRPIVILTSNNYRELSDALKRRCLYLYIEMPNKNEMANIIYSKANVSQNFAKKIANEVSKIRGMELKQLPSISESISWAQGLMSIVGEDVFVRQDREALINSLGILLKNHSDLVKVQEKYLSASGLTDLENTDKKNSKKAGK